MVDANGDTVTTEIPKEIYYWYIVHPQITDEIAGFVLTDQHEFDHFDVMTTPDLGEFWRSYIFEHNNPNFPNEDFGSYTSYVNSSADISAVVNGIDETEYKALAINVLDSLSTIQIYWDGDTLGQVSPYMPESYYPQNVLALLDRYVWSCMRFWSVSDVERPHQPVRIINWGMGRCGEHEDLTIAVGRTALIPVAGIEGLSADHTFNAFYDPLTQQFSNDYNIDNWKVWETTITGFVSSYINHDNDGNRWASLNFTRSDGFTYPIIEQFSNGVAELIITVKDANNRPIDGAHVGLFAQSSTTTDLKYDNAGMTDHEGKVYFTVGDQRKYYLKVYAEGEENPAGNYVGNASNGVLTVDGNTYSTTVTMSIVNLPVLNNNNTDSVFVNTAHNKLNVNLTATREYLIGKNLFNDLSSSSWYYGTQVRQYKDNSPDIEVFQLNQNEASNYLNDQNFNSFNFVSQNQYIQTLELLEEDTYFVVRNKNKNNYIELTGNIELQDENGTTIDVFSPDVYGGDDEFGITKVEELKAVNNVNIYPNPAKYNITIESDELINKVQIFDMTGKLLIENNEHNRKVNIDLNSISNGIYTIKVSSNNNVSIKKIIKS